MKIIYGRFKLHVQVKLLYQALQSNSVHNYYSTLITMRYRKIFPAIYLNYHYIHPLIAPTSNPLTMNRYKNRAIKITGIIIRMIITDMYHH